MIAVMGMMGATGMMQMMMMMGTMGTTGMTGMMGTTHTLYMEEGPRRVLPGTAACPTRVVPLISGLNGTETQRPTMDHRPRRQRAYGDTAQCHPQKLCPQARCWCPPHPRRAPTEPLEGGWGVTGNHAAKLGRLPRCYTQLCRLHGGGGGGGGAGCGETQGGGELRARRGPPHGAGPSWWGQWEAGGWRGTAGGRVRSGAPACSRCGGWGVCGPPHTPTSPTMTYLVCAPP